MRRLGTTGFVVALALAVIVGACKEKETKKAKKAGESQTKTKKTPPPTPTPTPTETAQKIAKMELRDGAGAVVMVLEPYADGYRINGSAGEKLGKIKAGTEKIKVKDSGGQELAKAKKKGAGFKIYSADDKVLLKVKSKGDKYKLSLGNDAELGRIKGTKLKLSAGEQVTAEASAEVVTVKRDGKTIMTVSKVPADAAVYLGITELTVHQRVAAMVAKMRW